MDTTFDKMFYDEGTLLAGMDESGVSDVAGPLVAACVILPRIDTQEDDLRIFEVTDSKDVPEKYRKKHAEIIWQTAIGIGIGEVQPTEIDYIGVIDATRLAMYRALAACKATASNKSIKPDFVLIDAIKNFSLPIRLKHKFIDEGDKKSLCIASASIVAKVYRDDIMQKLHKRFPHYDWISNKGYPCENQFRGIDHAGVQVGIHRIKRWPFIKNPSLPEDHAAWGKRRRLWKRVTLRSLCLEADSDLISSKF